VFVAASAFLGVPAQTVRQRLTGGAGAESKSFGQTIVESY
jgi:hypothetical protein